MARILIGNIKGPKGNQGIQGIQGPIGPVGPQGPLPPLANNGLTTQAGAAALDAAYGKTLADGLSSLNSEMQLKNISTAFTPVNLYVSTVRAYQYGKVIMVFGTFTKDLPTGSVGNIADVITINDSRYYPIFFAPGCDSTNSATADMAIKVNVYADPVGVIKAMSPVALSAPKRFMVSYMIA